MDCNCCEKRTTTREELFNNLERLCFGGSYNDHVYCFPQIYYYFERNPSHLEPLNYSEKDVLKGFLHEEACLFLTSGMVGNNPRVEMLGMQHYRLSVLPAVHKFITTERERECFDELIRKLTKSETQLMRDPGLRKSEDKVTSILGTWEELNEQLDRTDYWDLLEEYRMMDWETLLFFTHHIIPQTLQPCRKGIGVRERVRSRGTLPFLHTVSS